MSDDFTLDFSDTEAMGSGFDPLPRGWYTVVVSDWSEAEVGDNARKLAPGTKGTTYELTVDEGEYENRKLWANFWHAPSSLGFWKGFLVATGRFNDDELSGALDIDELRERPQGARLQVRVKIRPAKGQYEASNQIQAYKAEGEDVGSNGSGADSSFLP